MTTVRIDPDGSPTPSLEPLAGLPRRTLLSRPALEHLGARADVSWPWQRRPPTTDLERALGDRALVTAVGDPERELVDAGLLDGAGRADPWLVAALAAFERPEVSVDVDLAVSRPHLPGGFAQLRAWHRLADGHVTSLTAAGPSSLELAWFDARWWQGELARHARVEDSTTEAESPATGLELPLVTLLATGEALRTHRLEVYGELVARAVGQVRVGSGRPWDAPGTAEQLRRLHAGVSARLQTVVAGPGPSGVRTLGVVSWLRYADGWRELIPIPGDDGPRVRLSPVSPWRLGAEVARLVRGVRA